MHLIHQEEQALGKSLAQEKMSLLGVMEASKVRIRELEEDIKTLTQRTVERETELERSGVCFLSYWGFFTMVAHSCLISINNVNVCRLKERAKRAGAQRKEEESERKSLQVTLQINQTRLRSAFRFSSPAFSNLCCFFLS